MDDRLRRQARNEALIREVNERIDALEKKENGWSKDGRFEFLCECGREEVCHTTVELTLVEYERVRSQDDRFAVHPGHETDVLEHVVERHERWVLVDKVPDAEAAVADDPRGVDSR